MTKTLDSSEPSPPYSCPGWAQPGKLRWSWWDWEPMDHYRRAGGTVGAVDASARWLHEWYDRIHSEDLVEEMADMGVNLAITHFFKGFGIEHEREAMERTKELIELCHRHGIHVLGYTQFRSIYYEAFLSEVPRAEDWIQREEHGHLRTWGGAYYRWTACISCREFVDYLRRCIDIGLKEVGLDGFHFDNSYSQPCYCERCQEAFRTWLTEHWPEPRDRFGLAGFDNVRIPPFREIGSIRDPIYQEWVRFRCDTLARVMAELHDHIKSQNPDAVILANPAFPKDPACANSRSVSPVLFGKSIDLMWAENGNFPHYEDGCIVSQIRAYKIANACGYQVISTTWLRDEAGSSLALPHTREQIELFVAEAAAFGGIPGTNWALRSAGGDRVINDDQGLRAPLARCLGFLKENEQLYVGAVPVANVAVYCSTASFELDPNVASASIVGIEEVLIRHHIPYSIVFSEHADRLAAYQVLIVPNQRCLSDAEAAAIRGLVKAGGALLVTGESGCYDEHFRDRLTSPFSSLATHERVHVFPDTPERVDVGSGHTIKVDLPDRHAELAALILDSQREIPVRIEAPDYVAAEVARLPSEDVMVHLVNYDNTRHSDSVTIDLPAGEWQAALLIGFTWTHQPVAMTRGDERDTVSVPAFKTYQAVRLTKEPLPRQCPIRSEQEGSD